MPDAETPVDESSSTALPSPESYLADICGGHQIVFLGDQIGVQQHLSFLAGAFAELADAGVTILAWEFTNSRSQSALDELLAASEWDERACCDLFVDLLGAGFGYQEYAEVLRAAWEHNAAERKRSSDQRPIRVVALGLPSYVEDPQLLDGRSAAELGLRNWWLGGHYRDMSAFHAASVLTNEVLRQGERALVYMNVTATTTKLIEWADGVPTASAGNLLWRWMRDGCRRVLFHGVIADTAATQRVEDLVAQSPEVRGRAGVRFGLDLAASPLGSVAAASVRGTIDGSGTGLRLRDIADGYIYLGPREEWSPCTLIGDLLTGENFDSAEARYRALDPRPEPYSRDELEAVRRTGQQELSEAWPPLPEPPEETKRRRFGRRTTAD
ncbi:hypothetical protein [Candidatus Poriferisodalis sp.]|uniref:hypothetical protein n=1 Tax=Candidatus Poriferisodalis sp. TaxID=3101277 RepID=UPI003D0A8A7E